MQKRKRRVRILMNYWGIGGSKVLYLYWLLVKDGKIKMAATNLLVPPFLTFVEEERQRSNFWEEDLERLSG
jgi:hypothetical protein